MIQVQSSNIRALEYDKEALVLVVQFVAGPCYIYMGVPQEIYEKVLNAESVGKSFNSLVRGQFDCERISDVPLEELQP